MSKILAILVILSLSVHVWAGHKEEAITTVGASITAGTGASNPLMWRINQHFLINGVDAKALLGDKKVLIAYDYFFPTNFQQQLDDPAVDVEKIVKETLLAWSAEYDYVLVGDLIDRDALGPDGRKMLDADTASSPRYENLRNIYGWIYKTSPRRSRAAQAVTQAIQSFAEMHPGTVLIMRNAEFVNGVDFADGGYRVDMDGSPALLSPDSLFADAIHFNDSGQAFLFNTVILPQLGRIPELQGRIPPMVYSDPRSAEVSSTRRHHVGDPQKFAQADPGTYWATIDGISPVWYAVESVADTVSFGAVGVRNPLAKDNAKLFVPSGGVEAHPHMASDVATLKEIRSGIAAGSFLASGGFIVKIQEGPSGTAIGLDLRQVLFYTMIFSNRTGPDTYLGYGYDFWSSVDKKTPPITNYVFKLEQDAQDRTKLNVTWRLIPLLTVGGLLQPTRHVREATLDRKWVEEIEANAEKYPYLEYHFTLSIVRP